MVALSTSSRLLDLLSEVLDLPLEVLELPSLLLRLPIVEVLVSEVVVTLEVVNSHCTACQVQSSLL